MQAPKLIIPVLLAITLVLFISCTVIFLDNVAQNYTTSLPSTVPQDGLFLFN